MVSNWNLLFQGSIFRGYVSFREGIVRISYVLPLAHPCFPALTMRFAPLRPFPPQSNACLPTPVRLWHGVFVEVKPQDSPPWEGGDKKSLKVTFHFSQWLIWLILATSKLDTRPLEVSLVANMAVSILTPEKKALSSRSVVPNRCSGRVPELPLLERHIYRHFIDLNMLRCC